MEEIFCLSLTRKEEMFLTTSVILETSAIKYSFQLLNLFPERSEFHDLTSILLPLGMQGKLHHLQQLSTA